MRCMRTMGFLHREAWGSLESLLARKDVGVEFETY